MAGLEACPPLAAPTSAPGVRNVNEPWTMEAGKNKTVVRGTVYNLTCPVLGKCGREIMLDQGAFIEVVRFPLE